MYTGSSPQEWDSYIKSREVSKRVSKELFGRLGYYLGLEEANINKPLEDVLYKLSLERAYNV